MHFSTKPSSPHNPHRASRRDFLKKAAVLGSLAAIDPVKLFAATDTAEENPHPKIKYRCLSVGHFPELQEEFERIKRSGKLSRNETFQGCIKNRQFVLPDNFKEAKSVIVMAVFSRAMRIRFHLKGKKHDLVIPPQYYDDGIDEEQIKAVVRNDIVKSPAFRIERVTRFPLKMLAARCGLGRYGRNNLCYVDGMGTYHALYSFLTDFVTADNPLSPMEMLKTCERCKICYGVCPTECISRDRFVIDAGRCITLYNEIESPFPSWIRPRMHNALMGCMKCQNRCPENLKIADSWGRLEDITEEETKKILDGTPDEALFQSLKEKMKNFYPATSRDAFPILTRNLRVLLG